MLVESPEEVLMLIASKLVPYKRIAYFNETFVICRLTFEIKASLLHSTLLRTHKNE